MERSIFVFYSLFFNLVLVFPNIDPFSKYATEDAEFWSKKEARHFQGFYHQKVNT